MRLSHPAVRRRLLFFLALLASACLAFSAGGRP